MKPSRADEAYPGGYLRERVLIGPAICQGCREEVVYHTSDTKNIGWIHASGTTKCPRKRRKNVRSTEG